MKLMPKISTIIEQSLCMKDYIDKYGRMEIQFFQEEPGSTEVKFEETIDKYINEFKVKEITIHPPLEEFDIEYIILRDLNYMDEYVDRAIKLSRKHNIRLNLLFHTNWSLERLKFAVAPRLESVLKKIENENVYILLENLIFNHDRKKCSPLEFCDYMNHPKLKVCIDICHLHAKSNLLKKDINEFTSYFLDKEKCEKHVYQIHFSYVANNDGYADKSTHGIVHKDKESLLEDIKLLKQYGMGDKIIVTEIGEKDYTLRLDQRQEIEWLVEVL